MKLSLALGLCAAAAIGGAGAASAKSLDPSTGEGALAAYRKLQCSLKDGEAVVYHWSGHVYARTPGEPDRRLFNVEGMNVRQCATVHDPRRGTGFRMVSRELMVYVDPETGEPLHVWANPWTGKTLEPVHVANDPVNMRAPEFALGADGTPFHLPGRLEAGRIFITTEAPLFYKNPLAGDYQDYVGGQYHAMEIFDFSADAADVLDAERPVARATVAWVRISPWLPWMQMGDRVGQLVFNASGQIVEGVGALPPTLQREIKERYPEWRQPPPLDDARPNETSWTYFKKSLAKTAAEGAH